MVEANPSSGSGFEAATSVPANRRSLTITGTNFIHMNEGNIKNFYKISSCIGRGKFIGHFFHLALLYIQLAFLRLEAPLENLSL